MDIERIVSGDLSRNIEQALHNIMDLERRVYVLKQELAQTMVQLQVTQQIQAVGGFAPPTGTTGTHGSSTVPPQAVLGTPPVPYLMPGIGGGVPNVGHPAWAGAAAGLSPYRYFAPLPGLAAFPAVPGLPKGAVPNYGYIW